MLCALRTAQTNSAMVMVVSFCGLAKSRVSIPLNFYFARGKMGVFPSHVLYKNSSFDLVLYYRYSGLSWRTT